MTAGWEGKKATLWRPSHELLHISLPAHIIDGFQIHCGQPNIGDWAKSATLDDIKKVARVILNKLFSTKELEHLHSQPDEICDFTFKNTILYNCDALFYIEFVHAIKHSDIGYAIFEMLGCLKVYDPVLRETIARFDSKQD
ncbi:hypothetical protein ARMSODRAFT_1016778 [Armillaria solidipes]|uniref:DUF6589 domain-containing protein n=1 Tax=Armillaria solidipes TaxID=1076256 RepID=A0A2H3BS53_9AGAR|nr:hypothetical protein ARMSODRAFT_1016778 [Armillaria solidipes]